jgi:TetR/AcrR family transcriptional regulator
MTQPIPRRGRAHDAAGAREAILDAAEAVFAEHGYDGARIEAIARGSSYNSGLIFHYFGDKLGLYAEVVRRADGEMSVLQAGALAPLLAGKIDVSDAAAFRDLLEKIVALNFDYLVDHPRFMRIMLWEQAEGWQTFAKIFSRFDADFSESFAALFRKARAAGLLRFDAPPMIQLSLILEVCMAFLAFMPLYSMALRPGEGTFSTAALPEARAYVVAFVVHGMMVDAPAP